MQNSANNARERRRRTLARTGPAPLLLWLIALGALAAGVLLAGCSRRDEPKITGKRSAAPVLLQCVWQPGHAYHLRMETEILTETDSPEAHSPSVHRVSFAQECLVTVTNATRGDGLNLDFEILSLEMERAKGETVALSFNSDQGGETLDEHGYIPVLKKLVGGRLRFALASDGKVTRAEGLSEWLDRALGGGAPVKTPTLNTLINRAFNPQPPGPPVAPPPVQVLLDEPLPPEAQPLPTSRVPSTNAPKAAVRKSGRVITTLSGSPGTPSSGRDNVARTLRGFFTLDLFRQVIEFYFLPPTPVRVDDRWNEQRDTHITTRSRLRYDAQCTFVGWQEQRGTNCARIEAEGKLGGQLASASTGNRQPGIDGIVWVNRDLRFPALTSVTKAAVFGGDRTTRVDGTNTITTTSAGKFVRQTLNITLLKVSALEGVTNPAELQAGP